MLKGHVILITGFSKAIFVQTKLKPRQKNVGLRIFAHLIFGNANHIFSEKRIVSLASFLAFKFTFKKEKTS